MVKLPQIQHHRVEDYMQQPAQSQKKTSELVEVTGLWENTSAKGEVYLSGTIGRARVLIFRNNQRTDKDPAWRMFFAPKMEKPKQDNGSSSSGRSDGDRYGDPTPF